MPTTATPKTMAKSFDLMLREANYPSHITADKVVEELAKAVSIGGLAGFGDLANLKLENLDATMTAVLFEQDHLKLFSAFPRVPSTQPLFQWIRRDKYGSHRGAVGFPEGGAPQGGISAWSRLTATVRYLGTRGGYTHQAMVSGQMGGTFVDPVTEENRNRTLELLEKLERQILWGQTDVKDQNGNVVHFDGLIKQMEASSLANTQIIDMESRPMDFEKLEDIGEKFVTTGKLLNFGRIRTWWKPHVLSDLAKLKFQAERIALGNTLPDGYRTGVPLDGHQTQRGFFSFEDSIFMDPVEDGLLLAVPEAGAAPKPAAVTGVAAADVTSKHLAGTYYYFASSINDKGESDTIASTGVAVNVGEKATLTITRETTATGYRLYRGNLANGTDAGWIATITQPPAGNATYVDLNQWRPRHGMGLLVNVAEADVAFAQMSPLIKWPLAITNTTIEFLLLLYGVLAVKAPERIVVVKNIGRRT